MKTNQLSFVLVAFFGLLFSHAAVADNASDGTLWACMATTSAGMSWNGSEWVATEFQKRPYAILFNGDQSRYGANIDNLYSTSCRQEGRDRVRCNDRTGGSVILNVRTGEGAISEILGAVSTTGNRDTLSVTAISCQVVDPD